MTQQQPYQPEVCGTLVVRLAGIVTGAGLLVGVVAGWYAMWGADDAVDVARRAGQVFPALGVVLPLALYLLARPASGGLASACYGTPKRALGILGSAGLLGTIGGMLLFVVVSFQVPSIFGGFDNVAVIGALRERLLWIPALGVLGGSMVGHLVVALLVWRASR